MNIKVTRIKDKFHARLFLDGKIIDEMICQFKADIGYICREMLRWQDKCGRSSKWTSAARKRQVKKPLGKVWYKKGEL